MTTEEIEQLQEKMRVKEAYPNEYERHIARQNKRIGQLRATLDRYRAALEEYANPENWRECYQPDCHFNHLWKPVSNGPDLAAATLAGEQQAPPEGGAL